MRAGRRRLTGALAASALLLAGTPYVLLGASPAWASTSVTPGGVKITDTTAGATTTYTIGFTTSGSGALTTGSTIKFGAPTGTAFPSCTLTCSSYTVTSASGNPGVSGASVSGSTVTISLGLGSIGNSTAVTVSIAGVTNPTVTSSGDSIQESTSVDSVPVPSATQYNITPGPVSTVSVVSGDGQTSKTGTAFHDPLVVLLKDRFGNTESPGVTVAFTAPSCGGSPCASATFSDGSSSEIVTTAAGGTATSGVLAAGGTPGKFTVTTSSGGAQALFTETDAAGGVTPGPVSPSSAVEGTSGVTYTVPFTTSASGALASGGTITFEVDQGPSLPTSTSDYTVSASGAAVAVSGVQVPTPRLVVITLGGAIGNSTPVSVRIAGMTNPTLAGTSYAFYEWTSADGGATSPAYAITPSAPASISLVSGDNQTAAVGQPFSQPLAVALKDKDANPVPGASVTFTLPSSTPTASFASGQSPLTATTAADGVATSPALTAGSTAGSYQAVATVAGSALTATFNLQNVVSLAPGVLALTNTQAGAPSTYTVPFTTSPTGGCQTSCTITLAGPGGTIFPSAAGSYSITVNNGHSATVSGASTSGGGSTSVISLASSTIAAGDLVTVTITGVANPTVAGGGYVMRESTSADSAPVPSNAYAITPGAPALIQTVLGDSQSALVFNPFASPLIAEVTDAYGNVVPNAQVTFSAPASMGGAAFASCDGGNPSPSLCVSQTDGSGYAFAPEIIAGSNSGVFEVVASTGAAQSAVFTLTVLQSGYWLVASDGGLFSHGGAPYLGSEGGTKLNKPVVGMSAAVGGGYYMVASDGGVFTFGAPFYGSTGNIRLNAPVVGMAVDPVTGGYWLVASDGGIFNFNAPFYGSEGGTHLNKPIVGMAATPEGGYYLVASDGGIFNFGPGATYFGSEGGTTLNKPIVGMAEAPGGGYYLVASDGGVFNFGPGAVMLGSAVGESFAPIVGMAVDPATGGYWMAASNGQIFNFGGAPFYGDESSHPLNQPIVGMAAAAAL